MDQKYLTVKIISLVSVLITHCTLTQAKEIDDFRKIDKLSNSSVNIIYQDSLEYIWIGTWDGLNRYDGKQTIAYFPELGNDFSISNNIIRDIKEERKGILWIETDWGINRLDIRTGQFERFFLGYDDYYPDKEDVYSIAIARNGNILASAWGWGLAYYDHAKNGFTVINTAKLSTQNIVKMEIDVNDNLWIYDDEGCVTKIRWRIADSEMQILDIETVSETNTKFFKIHDKYLITVNGNNELQIHDIDDLRLIVSKNIRSLILNVNVIAGHIVITYKSGKSDFFTIDNGSNGTQKLTYGKVTNITCHLDGTQNTTWIGTDGDGVYMFYNKREKFGDILFKDISWPIRSISEDNNGNIIVGTKGGGLFITAANNTGSGKMRLTTENGLISDRVYCLQKNHRGDIFIGTEGSGINIISNGKISKADFRGLSHREVTGIYSMTFTNNDSTLWIGTAYYGLLCAEIAYRDGAYIIEKLTAYPYNKKNKRPSNNAIYKIIASENDLLIATRGSGVLDFDLKTRQYKDIKCPDSSIKKIINNNDVLSLYQDDENNLWVGTSLGLNRLIYNKDSILVRMFTHKNNFPNNTIHGILEDRKNNIWISTNSGLSRFDKTRNTIVSYNEQDGLQGNEFCDGAYYAGMNGYLYFGGTKGLNRFNPDHIIPDNYIPQLHVEDIRINNIQVPIKNISSGTMSPKGDLLTFKHNENNLSLKLIVTDYINNENCEFSYYLEGLSQSWNYIGNVSNLLFPNLRPGKYKLLVRYTNSEKLWSPELCVMSFSIKPPLWRSFWAYLFYFSVLCLSIFFSIYYIHRRIEKDKKEFQRKITDREKELVHNAKLSFFTNIANEFITPLSLIYGPSIKIEDYEKSDSYIRNYASIIHSNAKRLNNLVSEIADYHNALNNTNVFFEYINLSDHINTIINSFSELAEEKNLRIVFSDSENPPTMCVCDRYCIEKILFNLISNAYKNTPENGEIKMKCLYSDKHAIIFSISHSGNGIQTEMVAEVFNKFSLVENIEKDSENIWNQYGLNLSVCKTLANKIEGDVYISRNEQDLTEFTLRIPQHMPTEKMISRYEVDQRLHNIGDNTRVSASNAPVSNKNILIIDEDTDLRLLIKDSLHISPHCAFEADDVITGMEILKTHKIDLIITDAFIQGISGVDFIKSLKSNAIFQHIPILFISRNLDEKYKNLALTSGVDTLINMPFNPNHLHNVVKAIFNQRRLYEKYAQSAISTLEISDGRLLHHEDKIFMEELTNLIEESLEQENLSIDEICSRLNISRISLYRKVKKLSGGTVSDFIKTIKIRKACYLLKSTKLSVKEVMYKCGYNHKSLFYKHFESLYNTTPRGYRDSLFNDIQEIQTKEDQDGKKFNPPN